MQSFSSPHLFFRDNYPSFSTMVLYLYKLSLQKVEGTHTISRCIAKSFLTGNIQKTLVGKSSVVRASRALENKYFLLYSLSDSTRMFPIDKMLIFLGFQQGLTCLLDFYRAFFHLKPVESSKGFKSLNLTQFFIFACLFLYLLGRNSNQPGNR